MKPSKLFAFAAFGLLSTCAPAMALEVGEVVGTRIGCKSQEIVERQITAYVEHGVDGVQAQLQVDMENGDCSAAPMVVPVEVQEVGKPSSVVKWEGEDATITPFRFGDQFWSAAVEEAHAS
ncbi:MAG TPA: hypothetical protein VIY48_13275 [Candidatus Paceibacterota bacterium]